MYFFLFITKVITHTLVCVMDQWINQWINPSCLRSLSAPKHPNVVKTWTSAYLDGPPLMLVLWWISFQVTWSSDPEVREVPTVKINLLSKALRSNFSTSLPSLLSGRYADLWVP